MKLFKAIALAQLAQAEVLFKEDFSQGKIILIYVEIYQLLLDGWESRWVQSKHKDDYGAFTLESGKWNDMLG